jgi:hypothetical protein
MVRLCRRRPCAPFAALALIALSAALTAPGVSRATPLVDTPGSEAMALVGQVGGVSRAVAVVGDIAYLGVGSRLLALDVSNPAAPTPFGRSAVLPGVVNAVVVTQTLAYVAAGQGGLRVLDVSEPARPIEIGAVDTPGSAGDLKVAGGRVYVADGSGGLRIIDVADPARPRELGALAPEGWEVSRVAVSGPIAYVPSGGADLRIIDVSNPEAPTEIGHHTATAHPSTSPTEIRGVISDIAVHGTYAYLTGAEFEVVDVSDPTAPRRVNPIDPEWNMSMSTLTFGIEVVGRTAYISTFSPARLEVVDLRSPERPRRIGYHELPAIFSHVAIDGRTAFVPMPGAGLITIDITFPNRPQSLGAFDQSFFALKVAGNGDIGVIGGPDPDGLTVVDLSHPTDPAAMVPPAMAESANDVVTSGSLAYVAASAGGLRVIDLADPEKPIEIGRLEPPETANSLALAGHTVFMVDTRGRLWTVDVSDPSAPSTCGRFPRAFNTQGSAIDVAVAGNRAYVANGTAGLSVLGASCDPTEVGHFATTGRATLVFAEGTTVYLADDQAGLTILDVSDPTDPRLLGRYAQTRGASGGLNAIVVADGLAYLSYLYLGIEVVDFTDPAHPIPRGFFPLTYSLDLAPGDDRTIRVATGDGGLVILRMLTPHQSRPTIYLPMVQRGHYLEPVGPDLTSVGQLGGRAGPVFASGSRAYAGIGQRLKVLDVSNPDAPVLLGETPPLGYSIEDIVVRDTLAYIAAGPQGLKIFDVSDPARPVWIRDGIGGVSIWAVTLDGNRAYLAAGRSGLIILDLGDPAAPVELVRYNGPGPTYEDRIESATDVAVVGHMAYVTNNDEYGLWAIDVTNPRAPRRTDMSSQQDGVAVAAAGHTVFQIDNDSGLTIYDASDPETLKVVGWMNDDRIVDIVLSGRHAYLASRMSGEEGMSEVRVVDVGDPARPKQITAIETPGQANALGIDANRLYVGDGNGGVRVVDVTTPAAPRARGAYAILGGPKAIDTAGHYAYVANSPSAGLYSHADPDQGLAVVDIADAQRPVQRAFLRTPALPVDVLVGGSYVYLACGAGGVRVVDIADPRQPADVAVFPRLGDGIKWANGLALGSDRLYVASLEMALAGVERGKVWIVDVSDPTAPREIGAFTTPVQALGPLAVRGTTVFAADSGGLQIVDAAHPAAPRRLGAIPGYFVDVAVVGSRLYGLQQTFLEIYDVADPAKPRRLRIYGFADDVGIGGHMKVAGRFAVIATTAGLVTLDVGDPAAPYETSRWLGSSVWDLALGDGFVFAATEARGLEVFGTW